jgi:hypothetical protein
MADNITLNAGSGGSIVATDEVNSAHYQYVKHAFGGDGTATPVTSSVGLPGNLVQYGGSAVGASNALHVQPGTGASFTVANAGTFAVQAAQSGTWSVSAAAAFPVTDNSGSLTVDAPVGSPVFVRLSDGSGAITSLSVTPAATESQLGFVGSPGDVVDVTLTLDTSAYAGGDLLADTQSFTGVRVNGGRAILQSVTVIDEDDQGAAFTIYFLSANNSFGTENSAPSISDANARDVLGWVDVSTADYKDLGGVRVASVKGIGLLLEAAGGSTSLYLAVVNGTGTPTYTASGVKLKLGLLWD